MRPAPITPEMAAEAGGRPFTFRAPPSLQGCVDVEVVHLGHRVLIPWELEPGDLEALSAGSVIWLGIDGSVMPPVCLYVEPFQPARKTPAEAMEAANRLAEGAET